MSAVGTDAARGHLLVAFEVCRHLAALVASGRQAFDSDPDRRAQLRYLWIVAGTRLAGYRAAVAPAHDRGALCEVIALRHKLARTAPARIDDRLLWRATQHRAMALARHIATTLERLG